MSLLPTNLINERDHLLKLFASTWHSSPQDAPGIEATHPSNSLELSFFRCECPMINTTQL